MRFNLLPSTRMGLQAAVSIAIAAGLGYLLPIEKPYWALLTAMLLISQTWGESVKKSIERVSMTIAGGALGTLLYYFAQDYKLLCFTMMLSSVFLIIYFIEISYLVSVFFVTVFVVFLFAGLQGWNTHLLVTRIYETFIGAIIAIITSAIIFPIKAHNKFQDKIPNFLKLLNESLDNAYHILYEKEANLEKLKTQHKLILASYLDLQKSSQASQFENFFKSFPQKKFKKILLTLNLLMHYVTNVLQTTQILYRVKEKNDLKQEIMQTKDAISNNLNLVADLFSEKKAILSFIDTEPFRLQARTKILCKANEHNQTQKLHLLELYPYFYYLNRVNETIHELKSILCKEHKKEIPISKKAK